MGAGEISDHTAVRDQIFMRQHSYSKEHGSPLYDYECSSQILLNGFYRCLGVMRERERERERERFVHYFFLHN